MASDPTISRPIPTLASDAPKVLKAINDACSEARAEAWRLAGRHAPNHGVGVNQPLTIDVVTTLVTAHSDKEDAKPTFKKGYGFHPLCVFADHGTKGAGEPLTILLRPAPPTRTRRTPTSW